MITDNIYKLCSLFKKEMIKKSDVASDLATRIMHSLVPISGHPEEDRQKLTHLVSTHLIGVAERYIENAIKIIMDELQYSFNIKIAEIAYKKFPKEKNLEILELSIKSFLDPSQWEVSYGGKKWASFAEKVTDLYHSVNKFKKAKQDRNIKVMNEQSGMISVYLNVLDGMTHNSDSFLNRIINQEITELTKGIYNEESLEIERQKQKEIIDLMDSKELHNKQDVIPFIRKKIYENPDSYLYREHLRSVYNPQEKSTPENIQREMRLIRKKKEAMNFVNSFIDNFISRLEEAEKNGDDVENYLYYLEDIVEFELFTNVKKYIIAIIKKYNTESIYGLINAVEEIKDFILDNIELIIVESE